jgi:hypothetical protein
LEAVNNKNTESEATAEEIFSPPVNEPPSPVYNPAFSPLEDSEDAAKHTKKEAVYFLHCAIGHMGFAASSLYSKGEKAGLYTGLGGSFTGGEKISSAVASLSVFLLTASKVMI